MKRDLLTEYLDYTDGTEPHKIYYRWSAIGSIGALIGRNRCIPFGHMRLFPNFYIMLLGDPSARKSTAIKITKRIIAQSNYDTFSSDRTSREKFLLDLAGDPEEDILVKGKKGEDITSLNLWGDSGTFLPREVFIVADEFNDFTQVGNIDFYTSLANMWDYDDAETPYRDRVKNSKSVSIYQPTISLLGGNTQENFAKAFPPEILGHGFLARLLIIHGEPSGRKIAWPEPPDAKKTEEIVKSFTEVFRQGRKEKTLIHPKAKKLLAEIYENQYNILDPRFKHYNNRRYTHLLKLCIIITAAAFEEELTDELVIYANTILSAAEFSMPKAIGEFGKSKTSDVSNKTLSILSNATKPISAKILWRAMHKDLDRISALSELLHGLSAADRIQYVKVGNDGGWLPKKEVPDAANFVNWDLLTEEERNLL